MSCELEQIPFAEPAESEAAGDFVVDCDGDCDGDCAGVELDDELLGDWPLAEGVVVEPVPRPHPANATVTASAAAIPNTRLWCCCLCWCSRLMGSILAVALSAVSEQGLSASPRHAVAGHDDGVAGHGYVLVEQVSGVGWLAGCLARRLT